MGRSADSSGYPPLRCAFPAAESAIDDDRNVGLSGGIDGSLGRSLADDRNRRVQVGREDHRACQRPFDIVSVDDTRNFDGQPDLGPGMMSQACSSDEIGVQHFVERLGTDAFTQYLCPPTRWANLHFLQHPAEPGTQPLLGPPLESDPDKLVHTFVGSRQPAFDSSQCCGQFGDRLTHLRDVPRVLVNRLTELRDLAGLLGDLPRVLLDGFPQFRDMARLFLDHPTQVGCRFDLPLGGGAERSEFGHHLLVSLPLLGFDQTESSDAFLLSPNDPSQCRAELTEFTAALGESFREFEKLLAQQQATQLRAIRGATREDGPVHSVSARSSSLVALRFDCTGAAMNHVGFLDRRSSHREDMVDRREG